MLLSIYENNPNDIDFMLTEVFSGNMNYIYKNMPL